MYRGFKIINKDNFHEINKTKTMSGKRMDEYKKISSITSRQTKQQLNFWVYKKEGINS